MNKQICLLKTVVDDLKATKSEKFMELYFDFIEFFNVYFKNQALDYIDSLANYPELKLNKTSAEEDLQKRLKTIFSLWQEEWHINIVWDLIKSWNTDLTGLKTISNEYALEYADKHSWELLLQVNDTTQKAMTQIITDGIKDSNSIDVIAWQIKDKFANYTLYRSTLIATMEVAQAYSQWEKKQYDIWGSEFWVTGFKRSITQHDESVRESHKANELAWWISRNQVYPWTWTMNAPHWFMCRCHDINSLTNPDTGYLYDDIPNYTQEQKDRFKSIWWKPIDLTTKERELQAQYNLTSEEILSFKNLSWNSYINITNWYKASSTDEVFQSWIQFLLWWLNKLPKYEWTVYRWHKTTKSEFAYFEKFQKWDSFSYNAFLSSSKSKKVAKWFMWDNYQVLFEIKSKKWISFEDFSLIPAEREVLFMPKTLFRIETFEKNDKSLKITLIDL